MAQDDFDRKLREHCLKEDLPKDSWQAVCVHCGARMPGNAVICPGCGHDYREEPDEERRAVLGAGSAFDWADAAMFGGQVSAGLGAFAGVVGLGFSIWRRDLAGAVAGTYGAIFMTGIAVMFSRVRRLSG